MSTSTTTQDEFIIPLIDFSGFLNGTPEKRKETAKTILHGFRTAGFIYLQNLPFTLEARQHVFKMSAEYFRQPLETKLEHSMPSVESNRGYAAEGREKLGLESPDIKETLHVGREDDENYPNFWQEEIGELVGFKETINGFYDFCSKMSLEIMSAIAVGLDLDESYFDRFMARGDHKLRLLHYPEVSKKVFKSNTGQVRAGAHTDYGAVTLLFQDARGGLQVMTPSGEYKDATPIPNTIVVNAGDLLARWSNEVIKSTLHRVVEPPATTESDIHPARYSIAFFANPNVDAYIEAIPGTFETEADKKYQGIESNEYYLQRLTATH